MDCQDDLYWHSRSPDGGFQHLVMPNIFSLALPILKCFLMVPRSWILQSLVIHWLFPLKHHQGIIPMFTLMHWQQMLYSHTRLMLCPSNFGKSPDFDRLMSLVVHVVPSQSLDRLWDLMQTSGLQEINCKTFDPLIFPIWRWRLTSEQSSKRRLVTMIWQWLPSGYYFKLDPQLTMFSVASKEGRWKNYTHGNPLQKKGQELAQVLCFLHCC